HAGLCLRSGSTPKLRSLTRLLAKAGAGDIYWVAVNVGDTVFNIWPIRRPLFGLDPELLQFVENSDTLSLLDGKAEVIYSVFDSLLLRGCDQSHVHITVSEKHPAAALRATSERLSNLHSKYVHIKLG